MYAMNRQVNLPAMQRVMMQFEKEGDMMEMKQEMMDDTIDDVMSQEGDQAAEDELVNQVLDEIGINLAADLADAPTASFVPAAPVAQAAPAQAAVGGGGGGGADMDDLAARLNNLRK
jgi:charged multivesicular body protein 2A